MERPTKKIPVSFVPEPAGEEPEAAAEAPAGQAPEETGESSAERAVPEQLAKLQAERDELYGTLVRRQADFENYRKRIERERREDAGRSAARVVESLLPVLDAFDRALAPAAAEGAGAAEEYRRGFELIYRQLAEALARYGLERIQAAGRPFDPHLHHAVERVETAEHPEGTVVEELQPGYKMGESVLRPSMVRVAARPAGRREDSSSASGSGSGERVN